MPIYEYRCESCQTSFEALVTRNDPQAECPQCGGHQLARELSVFAAAAAGAAPMASGPMRGGCGSGGCGSGGCGCH